MTGFSEGYLDAGTTLLQQQAAQDQHVFAIQQMQAQQQKMQDAQQAALVMQAAAGQGGTPAEQFQNAALGMAKAGQTDTAMKLAKASSGLMVDQSKMISNYASASEKQIQAARGEADMLTSLLNGVTDKTSYENAKAVFTRITGHDPLQGVPYSPELVTQLQRYSFSLKDAIEAQDRDNRTRIEQARQNLRQRQQDFTEDYRTQQLGIQRDREERLRRAGGRYNTVGAPGKNELDQASDAIKAAYPDLGNDQLTLAMDTVAARAKALEKMIPGLDFGQAVQRAMMENRDDFQNSPDTHWFGPDTPGTKTDRFVMPQPGSRADVPIDAGAGNPQNPVAGQYYRNARGDVFQYAGKDKQGRDMYRPVQGAPAAPQRPSGLGVTGIDDAGDDDAGDGDDGE